MTQERAFAGGKRYQLPEFRPRLSPPFGRRGGGGGAGGGDAASRGAEQCADCGEVCHPCDTLDFDLQMGFYTGSGLPVYVDRSVNLTDPSYATLPAGLWRLSSTPSTAGTS